MDSRGLANTITEGHYCCNCENQWTISAVLKAGRTSAHKVTPGCFKLNFQTLRRKAAQTWGIRPADPTSSQPRSEKERGLFQKLAALWSMTKVLDRGGVRFKSQRLSGKLKEGSERSQTSPWHEQTEPRLYLASHMLRTFLLSAWMAGQIAGICPLMTSFHFSFGCHLTSTTTYNRPLLRQPALAAQEDVLV